MLVVVAMASVGTGALGHPLVDSYLELVAARARPNTVLAQTYDLKVFFSIVQKDPAEVTHADVLAFIKAQRQPRLGDKVVRIEDGEAGLSARTIKRRLATIAGLHDYLIVRGDTQAARNPVPRGLAVRRPGRFVVVRVGIDDTTTRRWSAPSVLAHLFLRSSIRRHVAICASFCSRNCLALATRV